MKLDNFISYPTLLCLLKATDNFMSVSTEALFVVPTHKEAMVVLAALLSVAESICPLFLSLSAPARSLPFILGEAGNKQSMMLLCCGTCSASVVASFTLTSQGFPQHGRYNLGLICNFHDPSAKGGIISHI